MNDDILRLQDDKTPRADAIRNRKRLLETADRLFREHGVAKITMSAIAEEAQVGKGTLYRHFTDKSEVCIALLDADMQALQARTFATLSDIRPPADKLAWFLAECATYVIDHITLLQETAHVHSSSLLVHQAHGWWRQTIRGLLLQCGVSGDVEYCADVLYVLLDVQTLRYQHLLMNYPITRIVSGLHQTLYKLIV